MTAMSNFGFGFGQFGQNEPGRDPDDLAGKIPLFAELQRLLAGCGGPVNWDLARQLAISSLAAQHRRDHAGATTRPWPMPSGWPTSGWTGPPTCRRASPPPRRGARSTGSRRPSAPGPRCATRWPAGWWLRCPGAMPPEMAEQAGPMAPMMASSAA